MAVAVVAAAEAAAAHREAVAMAAVVAEHRHALAAAAAVAVPRVPARVTARAAAVARDPSGRQQPALSFAKGGNSRPCQSAIARPPTRHNGR